MGTYRMSGNNDQFTQRMRQRWMKVLAKASLEDLEDAVQKTGSRPDYQFLRNPETGMVMVRARAGGTGQRFNLGEITVTRCVVRTDDGDLLSPDHPNRFFTTMTIIVS